MASSDAELVVISDQDECDAIFNNSGVISVSGKQFVSVKIKIEPVKIVSQGTSLVAHLPMNQQSRKISLSNCTLLDCEVSVTHSGIFKIIDSKIINSKISGRTDDSLVISNVLMSACRITAGSMERLVIKHAEISDSQLEAVYAKSGRISVTRFFDCEFIACSLDEIAIEKVGYFGSDLSSLTCKTINNQGDWTSHIVEATKNAKNIYTLFVASASLIVLLLLSTKQNQPVKIPILAAELELFDFTIYAHLYLLGVYCYAQIYYYIIFKAISSLPAIFPDSTTIESKLPLWPPFKIILFHSPHLRKNLTIVNRFISFVVALTGWHLLPLVFCISISKSMLSTASPIIIGYRIDAFHILLLLVCITIFIWLVSFFGIPLILSHFWEKQQLRAKLIGHNRVSDLLRSIAKQSVFCFRV